MPPKEKRAAPISSSAFSFSLGTPAKKKAPPAVPAPKRDVTPLRTSARARPVSGLHTPQLLFGQEPKPKEETPRKRGLPSDYILAPQPQPAESPRRERRINSVFDTPFRVKAPTLQPLAPPVAVRERARMEEDVGVSPRKFKGNITYKGPGPPPSVRLATLLSSSNTAMVLFYTALQHAARANPSRHLRSAPVRLEVISGAGGRTHAAVLLRCAVRLWPSFPAPDEVTVVFQALPSDCPLVGVDPRVVGSREGRFEVGLWAPWSEGPGGEVFASRYLVAEAE